MTPYPLPFALPLSRHYSLHLSTRFFTTIASTIYILYIIYICYEMENALQATCQARGKEIARPPPHTTLLPNILYTLMS